MAEEHEATEAQLGLAGPAAVSAVPLLQPGWTAGEALEHLVGETFANASDAVVLDGGALVGVVSIEALLAAAPATPVGELAQPVAVVGPHEDLEAPARRVVQQGGRSIAVVEADGSLAGLVPPAVLLRLLEREHAEDLARLGGFAAGATGARSASQESVQRRLRHRLPWLGVGLAGAMGSAVIVGAFEESLRREVLLALFVPAVVYVADAVGTQTETVVIRGMAVGVSLRDFIVREALTGGVVGTLLGAAFAAFAYAVWGDGRVAVTVGAAMVVSCSIATLVAVALPYGLARSGADPAFGSGPLATVVQDLLSILAYFAVATAVVT